jgi:hypothetical protein
MQDLSGFLWDALIRKQNLMAPKMINKLRAIWIGLGKKTNKFSDFGNEPLFLLGVGIEASRADWRSRWGRYRVRGGQIVAG